MNPNESTVPRQEFANPYAPPTSNVEESELVLIPASRLIRLTAIFVDFCISILPGYITFHLIIYLQPEWQVNILQVFPKSILSWILITIASLSYIIVNGYLLYRRGQTVGKAICHIRIASSDGSIPTLKKSLIYRFLAFAYAQVVPWLGIMLIIVDILYFCFPSKISLHDSFSNTQVIKC